MLSTSSLIYPISCSDLQEVYQAAINSGLKLSSVSESISLIQEKFHIFHNKVAESNLQGLDLGKYRINSNNWTIKVLQFQVWANANFHSEDIPVKYDEMLRQYYQYFNESSSMVKNLGKGFTPEQIAYRDTIISDFVQTKEQLKNAQNSHAENVNNLKSLHEKLARQPNCHNILKACLQDYVRLNTITLSIK